MFKKMEKSDKIIAIIAVVWTIAMLAAGLH